MEQKTKVLKAFGRAVRENRLSLTPPVSQERLAELSGLHRTYVGDVERGTRNVSLYNIVRLAGALKTVPSALLAKVP